MVDISRKTYERNGMETIVDNDGLLRLNEKHKEEGLNHKNLREITAKYNSNHRYELIEGPKKQVNRVSIDKELAIKVIMDCRTILTHKFRTRLEFKKYNVILTKERSVLMKILSSFQGENMQTQYNVLSYRIDYKLTIEIDENGHCDRNIDYEIKIQKAIEEELDCKFLRIASEFKADNIITSKAIKFIVKKILPDYK